MTIQAASLLRFLRTVHGWLGIIVLPWIMIIGLTGFYLNHSRTILSWISGPDFAEATLLEHPDAAAIDLHAASLVAARYWPEEIPREVKEVTYHGFAAYRFKKPSGYVIVSRDSGHYYLKTHYQRYTYAPDDTLVHHKYYWSTILGELHVRGWIGDMFGRLLAGITAISMVMFAASGFFLWWMPRSKRIKRLFGLSSGRRAT